MYSLRKKYQSIHNATYKIAVKALSATNLGIAFNLFIFSTSLYHRFMRDFGLIVSGLKSAPVVTLDLAMLFNKSSVNSGFSP